MDCVRHGPVFDVACDRWVVDRLIPSRFAAAHVHCCWCLDCLRTIEPAHPADGERETYHTAENGFQAYHIFDGYYRRQQGLTGAEPQ